MIQTIKQHDLLNQVDAKDEFTADIEFVKIVYGLDEDKINKMDPAEIDEMAAKIKIQAQHQVPPVLMFYYKGRKFAYYPLELGAIEDMIAYEIFAKQNKLNALATIFFREVKHDATGGDWKEACGIKCKFIETISKEFTKYSVKRIKDFRKVDIEFFDDLPYQFIASAINFTMGIGQAYGVSTESFSQNSLKQRHKLMMDLTNQLLFGKELRYLLQQLKTDSQTYSDTAEQNPYFESLYKLHSTGWYNESLMKSEINKQINILNGGNNSVLFDLIDAIYSDDDLNLTQIKTLNNVIKILHLVAKSKRKK